MIRIINFLLFLNTVCSCSNGQENMLANNIHLYKNTPAWELAQAVEKEDVIKIAALSKSNQNLLLFQEPKFGQTILEWAVYTDRFKASKALLELGANPNIQSYNGTSAFLHAADKKESSDYVRLLLEYGADVNAVAKPSNGNNQYLKTPLIAASGSNLESVKILVENGADINFYNDKIHRNAIHAAYSQDNIEVIKYLVVEKNADFRKPLHIKLNGDSLYLVDLMRNMAFPLDSEEYRLKMEVIEYLKKHGMNYWETPIPKHLYKIYPEEYLEKY